MTSVLAGGTFCSRSGAVSPLVVSSALLSCPRFTRLRCSRRCLLLTSDNRRRQHGVCGRPLEAQAALDGWVREYNASRPHQALETRAPVTPEQRSQPASGEQRE